MGFRSKGGWNKGLKRAKNSDGTYRYWDPTQEVEVISEIPKLNKSLKISSQINKQVAGKGTYRKLNQEEEKKILIQWMDENKLYWESCKLARKTGNPSDLPDQDLKSWKQWKLLNGYE